MRSLRCIYIKNISSSISYKKNMGFLDFSSILSNPLNYEQIKVWLFYLNLILLKLFRNANIINPWLTFLWNTFVLVLVFVLKIVQILQNLEFSKKHIFSVIYNELFIQNKFIILQSIGKKLFIKYHESYVKAFFIIFLHMIIFLKYLNKDHFLEIFKQIMILIFLKLED